jgi:hypothetical protein
MTVARTVKFPLNDLPNFVFTNIVAAFCPLELDGGGAVSAGLPARRARGAARRSTVGFAICMRAQTRCRVFPN